MPYLRPSENPQTRPVTPEELARDPDNNSLELLDGWVVEKNTCLWSCDTEGEILFRLGEFAEKSGGARVFSPSLGYQCFGRPDRIRKPDGTVVRRERTAAFEGSDPEYMPIVPDLAVEVIAMDDLCYDMDRRVQEYLDAGFPLVWVVSPVARTITVHPNGGRPMILTADDEITAENALPGFRCKVADLIPPAVPAA